MFPRETSGCKPRLGQTRGAPGCGGGGAGHGWMVGDPGGGGTDGPPEVEVGGHGWVVGGLGTAGVGSMESTLAKLSSRVSLWGGG